MFHRKPAVAGTFYASNREHLRMEIGEYLGEAAGKKPDGEVVGLISPHAGYIYSGPVAAYSYNLLKDSGADLAVILAPSHRSRFDGASVIPEGVYETPLGNAEIDAEAGGLLAEKPGFGFTKDVHMPEHSLEVQVPFLQSVLGTFKILPVIIGTVNLERCRLIAKGISDVLHSINRRHVVVISTDLSHYHPYNNAVEIDSLFIKSLVTFDEEEVKRVLESRKAEACGEGPVLTGMVLCRELGGKRVEVLKYANSGDTAGDRSQVVGYLSAAIMK